MYIEINIYIIPILIFQYLAVSEVVGVPPDLSFFWEIYPGKKPSSLGYLTLEPSMWVMYLVKLWGCPKIGVPPNHSFYWDFP